MVRYSRARNTQVTASYTEANTAVPACISPDLITHIWLSMHENTQNEQHKQQLCFGRELRSMHACCGRSAV